MFQSTHPRGVRPATCGASRGACCVSIHAPAGGATALVAAGALVLKVFQSTHPRGVRQPHRYATRSLPWFQSTHPRGVRRGCDRRQFFGYRVSIHAPAGGATTPRPGKPPSWQSFNPRTRGGCDRSCGCLRGSYPLFQSTHPRGVRRITPLCQPRGIEFQSTHPRGVRQRGSMMNFDQANVSIHAPAGGAT